MNRGYSREPVPVDNLSDMRLQVAQETLLGAREPVAVVDFRASISVDGKLLAESGGRFLPLINA